MDCNLTRRRFIETSAALIGVSLVGCGGEPAPTPTTTAISDGSIELKGVGEIPAGTAVAFTFPTGDPGLIFTTKDGKTAAISAKCTHAGCTVEWNAPINADKPFRCPCHESEFTIDGKVLSGPAKRPLDNYSVRKSANSIILKKI